MSQTLYLNQKETNTNSSLNTKAVADADTTTEVMHALVNAAVAGSGTASARMYTEFSPDSSGEFEVAADYFRDADMYLGSGKLFAFMRDDFGGLEKFELEVLKGGAKGTVTRRPTWNSTHRRRTTSDSRCTLLVVQPERFRLQTSTIQRSYRPVSGHGIASNSTNSASDPNNPVPTPELCPVSLPTY
jgi:hypothetical protein